MRYSRYLSAHLGDLLLQLPDRRFRPYYLRRAQLVAGEQIFQVFPLLLLHQSERRYPLDVHLALFCVLKCKSPTLDVADEM